MRKDIHKSVTAIFDIGKTNKKFFLFDKGFKVVYSESILFQEIEDEDGFPTEDLQAIVSWVKDVLSRIIKENKYKIEALNFSSYGASLVHIDQKGKILTPLYNYLKPFEKSLQQDFYEKYGTEEQFSISTGSPFFGMLNSGLQLYWLKKTKPEIFSKIRYSMHLPQYLSYMISGIPVNERTSLGCHTALWNYQTRDLHEWVYREKINSLFPAITNSDKLISAYFQEQHLKVGVGIHDSSSALIPYIQNTKSPFVLISTGTWSITLNPFFEGQLTWSELNNGCVFYMQTSGKPVKSSRMFLGKEHEFQVKILADRYQLSDQFYKSLKFKESLYSQIIGNFKPLYKWKYLDNDSQIKLYPIPYDSFELAYYHLMIELVSLQVKSFKSVLGTISIEDVFVDGGFSQNDIFLKILSHRLSEHKIIAVNAELGSALGAAMVVSNYKVSPGFLKSNYSAKQESFS